MIINSISEFLNQIKKDVENWDLDPRYNISWFRAEKEDKNNQKYKLLPKLYLEIMENNPDNPEILMNKKSNEIENEIIQNFRMRARAHNNIPHYDRIDEWLFLMQHVETYTRLLDWTEGALIALYFAINRKPKEKEKPVVWMINPIIFNLVTNMRLDLPLSWNDGTNIYDKKSGELVYLKSKKTLFDDNKELRKEYVRKTCPGNIHAAFEVGECDYEEDYPIALKPQYIHPRVVAQKGCFTVHGKLKKGIYDLVKDRKLINGNFNEVFEEYKLNNSFNMFNKNEGKLFTDVFLRKYEINPDERSNLLIELRLMGITYYNLFPELTGLGNDLNNVYIKNQ
jgi:FRG domain-containing protein